MAIPSMGPGAAGAIEKAVDALAAVDEVYLLGNPSTPALGKSGVRYEREERVLGQPERWQSIPEILSAGKGDCEDLAAWMIAAFRVKGINAMPKVVPASEALNGRWHIVVAVHTGKKIKFYDPSRALGM